MRPHVDRTGFGWLEIEGERYEHDVLIRPGGKITRRKKKLSKRVYGTSHTISLDEARHVFEERAATLIVGSGQYGQVHLSREAADYFRERGCAVRLLPTPEAIEIWNETRGKAIGLFHVTC
jgi:hypothetical protein